MKKILLLLTLILFGLQNYAFSQRISLFGGSTHLAFGPTYNMWLNDNVGYGRGTPLNIGFDVMLLDDFKLVQEKLVISTGIALSAVNIHSGMVHYVEDDKIYSPQWPVRAPHNVKSSKFSMTYIEVPIEFVLRPGAERKKSFMLGIGGRIGYKIDAHTKYRNDVGIFKQKGYEIFNPLRAGATLRVGRGGLSLLGRYDFTPVFDKEAYVDDNTISAGLIIGLY